MRIAGLQILAATALVVAALLPWTPPAQAEPHAASAPVAAEPAAIPDEVGAGQPNEAANDERNDDDWDLQRRLQERLAARQNLQASEQSPRHAIGSDPFAPDTSVLDSPTLRQERIAVTRPEPADGGSLPAGLLRQLSLRWGGVLAWMGHYDDARDAYERAIALGRDDRDTWQALAHVRARSGDLTGAEGALLAALERTESPRDQASVFEELGEVYLALDRPAEAIAALERGLGLTPDALRMLGLYARARHELAPHWESPPPQPVLLFPETPADRTRAAWEARLQRGHAALPVFAQDLLDRIRREATSERGNLVFATLLVLMTVAWLVARRIKGRGDLAVTLAYPPELVGSFSVRLSSAPGRYKRQSRSGKLAAAQEPSRASTRHEHYAVSRETKFQRLPAGMTYVTVEGLLQDPASGEVVTDPFDEQAVRIVPKQTVHIDFEVAPRESVVDVRVTWNKRPAKDAAVAARGLPQSLRYARDGATRLRLRKGRHVIVIGSGDRVAEHEVELESFRAATVEVDLGRNDALIFKGCPPAVEPYLHGDLGAASRALERDGHKQLAELLLARLHRDQGQPERAAEHYERAGEWTLAAELRAELEQWPEAARLFEQGGAPGRAGDMHRAGGELLHAGACYEQDGDYDSAIDCYREAREIVRWIDALEKKGSLFPAAKLAVEHREQGRAIKLLQQIQPDHPHYLEACDMLTAAYLQEGHRDLAIQKIEERIASAGPDETPAELHSQLASLLEQEGEFERALRVLSELREREPTYPSIATRIEGLRKKQSERDLGDSRGSAGGVSKPTAFLAESRYQILEEVGRGGMGVVLKARDTRLERVVALKRLPDSLRDHPKAIQLFLREAQAAARLNHPNITTVYDTDQEDGTFFITMEMLEGSPVSKILKKRGRVSEKNAAQLGVQIAAGLEYAHSKGIVHRDIKSANLFFTVDKVVKIMDFGLAKMIEEVRRGTTVVGGTPYYMAPEQAAGDTVDHRADLYALGVTLYEFVTGKVPFLDGDVTYQHRHAPVPDPREKVEGLSDEFAALVMQLMAKDPAERPASAGEVGRRLAALIR